MVLKYKVINPFASAKAGDVFTRDNETGSYIMKYDTSDVNFSSSRMMCVTENVMRNYAKKGYLKEVEVVDTEKEQNCKDKIEKLRTFILSLKNTYTQRYESMQKKYEAGKIDSTTFDSFMGAVHDSSKGKTSVGTQTDKQSYSDFFYHKFVQISRRNLTNNFGMFF